MKLLSIPSCLALCVLLFGGWSAEAQLFENLRALGGQRLPVGDPSVTSTNLNGVAVDGPKDIAVADLDGDGTPDLAASDKDGSVTLYFGVGDGTFAGAQHLRTWTTVPADLQTLYFTNYYTNSFCDYQPLATNFTLTCFTNFFPPFPGGPPGLVTNVNCVTNWAYGCVGFITNVSTNVWNLQGPTGLRGLALADFTGDGRRDIAVASPGESLIYLFVNQGGRNFGSPTNVPAWFGVRDLAAGDFDGDGLIDLAAAGTTNGVVQYRSLGGGAFAVVTNILGLASNPFVPGAGDFEFPQPAYYLKALRQPGDLRDELLVSHAQSGKLRVLRAGSDGRLAITGELLNINITSLDAAPLLHPADVGAVPDLITAHSRTGGLEIRAGVPFLSQRFASVPLRRHFGPGGPRNVRIADLDGDGWNDVVVVAQGSDRVLTYHNDNGELTLVGEAFAGWFPREMDLGDFNGDGHPDLAVLNRSSLDASILLTSTNTATPLGFLALEGIYPVDGGVSGLELSDFNGDGRKDVLQLHRDSSEFSVRLTGTNGLLGPAVYYAITNGFNPAAQIAVDVNGDGRVDMVSANLSGSVTVSLGLANGTFGPEHTYHLPVEATGGLFALVAGDFDGDHKVDLAAGYFDCRITFFKGDGAGGFTFVRTDTFIYEPRSMVVGDFDQDGDLDIAGGALTGRFVVIENKGTLFDPSVPLPRREYSGGSFGANLQVIDQNGDGDPDLLFGGPGGFTLFVGGPGITFNHVPIGAGDLGGNAFVFADLDGDGDNDLANICSSNSCLTVQVFTNNQYITSLTVPVPATRYLVAGDLDGDGFDDLVGSGDVLWVALSSRQSSNAPPSELLGGRSASSGVVINEVLASNTSLPLPQDGDRTSDWVEIFNGNSQPVSMNGWRLMLIRTNIVTFSVTNGTGLVLVTNLAVTTNAFVFPADAPMQPRAHRLVICTDRVRTPYHSGFTLPAEGALLCLFNAQNAEVSRVGYPATEPNLAYSRYADGARRFVVNNIPSPAAPNVDNGVVKPELTLLGVDLDTLTTPEQRLRFRATATDDVGVMNVSLLWRRLDVPDAITKRVILFDDGMNEDGPMNDGRFMGVIGTELPPGAQIQFYLECTDLTDQTVTSPGNPRFVAAGQPPQMHSLAIGADRPPLEISEIVADNVTGLTDEAGGRPDWVELRNCSSNAISLAGITLAPKLFGDSERMNFTNRPSIGPGEHLIIFADGNPSQGQLHAPFRLDRLGGSLVLAGTTAGGVRFLIDAMTYGLQSPDTAFARLGCAGPWLAGPPTPRLGNITTAWRSLVQSDNFLLGFPTRPGRTYTVQYKDDLGAGTWQSLAPVRGIGLEQTVQGPLGTRRFFRVREE